jgi:Tfp pilus assembly PilM family ATPase
MTTTCGIHIDGRRYHLVAIDGGVRKHKVRAAVSGMIGPDEDPISSIGGALRRAVKEHKLNPTEVQLAVDSGLAAFRTLTLPFDDKTKIEEVIKFEIESDLPQWDIDEVLVDFIVLSSRPGIKSNLLVTALPKDCMEMQLAACEAGGLEAGEAELSGTALFDAAYETGCLADDTAQILVHVGATSTTVVVADGGRLSSVRAIRAGANPGYNQPGAHSALTEVQDDEEAEDQEASVPEQEDGLEVERRLRQTVQRIRRELGRTVSGAQTTNDIEAIYICGQELPDLVRDELFDTPVRSLEVLTDDEMERPSEFVVAYGAALHAMGAGALSPSLRREELRYTGKFERLELPLAVFSLFLFTLLTVQLIVTNQQINWRDEGPLHDPGDMQIWMTASNSWVFPNPDKVVRTRLTLPPESIAAYAKKAQAGEDKVRTKYEEIKEISRRIKNEIFTLKKDLGQVSDIEQPQSALEATCLVMGVLRKLKETSELRFGIRDYKAQYRSGSGQKGDYVEIQLVMDFFSDSTGRATRDYSSVQRAIKAEDWCREYESKGTIPHDDDKGIAADRITIQVDLSKAAKEEQA